jgi:hypothetical protein
MSITQGIVTLHRVRFERTIRQTLDFEIVAGTPEEAVERVRAKLPLARAWRDLNVVAGPECVSAGLGTVPLDPVAGEGEI